MRYAKIADQIKADAKASQTPEAVIPAFQRALEELVSFCESHQVTSFQPYFERAITCFSATDPFASGYHKDLSPPGVLSLPAQQLLAASQSAWVFGGMGSWNDLYFKGEVQARYETLSNALFNIVNVAIVAGTNAGAEIPR